MTKLHLGVVDVPYTEAPEEPGKKRRKKKSRAPPTTGDVAEWIEDKYHVIENFYRINEQGIASSLENSLAGALESVMMGAPVDQFLGAGAAFATATNEIEDCFRNFIDTKGMDALGYPGVPTKAAIKGIRSRFKKRRDPGRPSFQDTGLYEASFKSWVD